MAQSPREIDGPPGPTTGGRPDRSRRAGAGGRIPARREASVTSRRSPDRPLYFISIAAELASVHPRTLRIYEEEGLVCPQRRNNLRLYSEADIRRVRIIRFLTRRQGVNLAGVKVILQLEALGKIRVYDLFDEADVERYVEGDEPEPAADLDRRDL
jgi:MerR family transcriptional regulator/heat shock protein HspR